MSGFDNDWRCPNHHREDGTMEFCPLGGCSEGCCALDLADMVSRLTGEAIDPKEVHVT